MPFLMLLLMPMLLLLLPLPTPLACLQESKIMVESQQVYSALGMPPSAARFRPPQAATATAAGAKPVYELRSYQLHPGYGTVPKVLEAFAQG